MPLIRAKEQDRSEQIQDIIERMPNKFGFIVTIIILSLVVLLLVFGWIIKYPDTVTGVITINARFAPIKLVSNADGKIQLFNFKEKDKIKEGDYIALIQNAANTEDMLKVKTLLAELKINQPSVENSYPSFPKKVSLGEANLKYYTFLNNFQQLYEYKKINVLSKQEESLKAEIARFNLVLSSSMILKDTHLKNMNLTKKFSYRDSILLAEKIATEEELDQSKINYLNSKENYQNIINNIFNTQQQIENDKSKLQQQVIQRNDKERQMQLDLLSSYNDIKDMIASWELHYTFRSPINGRVDFLKFLTNNQFIAAGSEVFAIIPEQNRIIGQVQLPASGAGKVKVGQRVIIKLDNYPYQEYGSIKGKVSSISLISNKVIADKNEIETYLVGVALPEALTTNYGKKLEFKYEIKGSADIVSNERRLIERFFDNLKYSTNK